MDTQQKVLAEINRAFPALAPDNRKVMRVNAGMDLESDQIRRELDGKKWTEIIEWVIHDYSSIFFLSVYGLNFYLAAYISAVLLNGCKAELVLESLIMTFITAVKSDRQILDVLDAKQKAAVADFFYWAIQCDGFELSTDEIANAEEIARIFGSYKPAT